MNSPSETETLNHSPGQGIETTTPGNARSDAAMQPVRAEPSAGVAGQPVGIRAMWQRYDQEQVAKIVSMLKDVSGDK